jgi:hypothetical protein
LVGRKIQPMGSEKVEPTGQSLREDKGAGYEKSD